MSYDLLVASDKALQLSALGAELAKWPDIQNIDASGDQIVVGIRLPNGEHASFFVGAPASCEVEDLDEHFFAYVKNPRWLTEITIPAHASGAGIEIARRVAIAIATTTQGAAFDPQEHGVFWPLRKLLVRGSRSATKPQKIDIVSLNWIVALPNDPTPRAYKASEVCANFLDVVARIQPAACPLRCGTYEPLQGNSVADFEREWRQTAEGEHGGMFHFTAKPPYFGGGVGFVYPRHSLESPKNSLSCLKISMDVDATDLNDSFAEHPLPVEFARIADGLAAMYGAAFYLRGYKRVGRRLWVPQGAESHPPLLGNGWIGLPPSPAWAVWMHAAYVSELRGKPAPEIGPGFNHGNAFLFAKHLADVAAATRMSGVPDDLQSRPGHIPHGAAARILPYERFA